MAGRGRSRTVLPLRAPPMDLSIIIVTYRHRDALMACLPTLPAACEGLEHELIVVDNASGDGLVAELNASHPEVRTILSPTNEGFARGVNRGLAVARGECVCFLNPDTTCEPGSLTALVGFARQHHDVGLVGPRLLDPEGSVQYSCRRFPTPWTGLFNRYSLLSRLFPNNRFSEHYLMLDFDHASVRDVDWITGACLVGRREVMEQLGGFDPGFFLFNEDVDLCHRLHDAGYRVVYDPRVSVTHVVGASRASLPLWLIWERHKGMMHYSHKHTKAPWPWLLILDLGILARFAAQVALKPARELAGRG
jgi:GT2 family glycosyltransferase